MTIYYRIFFIVLGVLAAISDSLFRTIVIVLIGIIIYELMTQPTNNTKEQ